MSASRQRQAEAARTQGLFRDVNERIRDLAVYSPLEILCECDDATCAQVIRMRIADYDRIRTDRTHFIVLPEHVSPDVERVAGGEHGSYEVVEKLDQAGLVAKRVAGASDGS